MIVYDLETYPNFFSCCAVNEDGADLTTWEISDRRDDSAALRAWLEALAAHRVEMVGFNNVGFDYPILHAMLTAAAPWTADGAYRIAQQIIVGDGFHVWSSDRIIPQIDLFKIHHMDNAARRTSLKALQAAMRSVTVEDLPIKPGTIVTPAQMDGLRAYGEHDVTETLRFLDHSRDMIAFRRSLDLTGDVLNFSDKKIGAQTFIDALGQDLCYRRDPDTRRREPRQTPRASIELGPLILQNVRFDHPALRRVRDWLASQTITETKGVFTDLHADVDGFRFDFGTGGIHGSVERKIYAADAQRAIIDVDVASLYPSIAIVNGFAPAHLGAAFVQTYTDLRARRFTYAKGTPENAALKLALNGAYGDSNNVYSPFYDPAFTMAVTINGQLQLAMLAERAMQVASVEMIQINTDGITLRIDRERIAEFERVCEAWEAETGLTLEYTRYSRMWIRDVNSYIAEGEDGKIKRKGAYDFPTPDQPVGTAPSGPRAWHGNPSALIVPKLAYAALRLGADVDALSWCAEDPFDFMHRGRARSGDVYRMGERDMPRTFRYFLVTDGEPLTVRRPPPPGKIAGDFKKRAGVTDAKYHALNVTGQWDERIHTKNRSVYDAREQAVHKGFFAADCSDARRFDWSRLDRTWYVERARELCDLTET
jgi:hypothetical protein